MIKAITDKLKDTGDYGKAASTQAVINLAEQGKVVYSSSWAQTDPTIVETRDTIMEVTINGIIENTKCGSWRVREFSVQSLGKLAKNGKTV